ncbi:molybdopterin-dependent oxidoreductase [Blastococcus brunescens]|uniref:Molybdopterin-dependent oxidoreductase n=1 Tax=Blastococcus brunescens TaxID=1564165 RepID=A0ABZ1AXP7_9ACTN|nr:molybdopterin-dependent oxidoreductase [Blastococcus sp. BMG 8361]WRL63342.1 molybdopterin-dependent oxidoreductase [Blastococcus sp. BMG 8361]
MTTSTQAPHRAERHERPRGRRAFAALAGLLSAAVALGVAELVAALVGPASSPVIAVGDAAITLTPEPVKAFAIRTFGENDKIALVVGTLAVIAVYALLVGLVGLRNRRIGVLGIALFGAVGVLAALTRPAGGPLDALPSLIGAGAGILALLALLAPLTAPDPAVPGGRPTPAPEGHADERVVDRLREILGSTDRKGSGLDRRRFFLTSGVALGAAAITGGGGRLLQQRFDIAGDRAALALPAPDSPAEPLPPGADLSDEIDGLTPLFTDNAEFYRVDTAIAVPRIRPADYRLEMAGMFDSPRSYTLADLFERDDLIERDITLTCVSNEVGGGLAGTARWIGVPLAALLQENGIRTGSDQLLCRSEDGMTIGAPTRNALEVEDAMLAFGMNGEPLPVEHGFPVRMLIPGLYGYVSACKWLVRIEATTFDAVDAYWTERDWAAEGPIKIASRIDTPAPLREFPAGRRAIAGMAWAQTRGSPASRSVWTRRTGSRPSSPRRSMPTCGASGCCPTTSPPVGTRSPCGPRAPAASCRPRSAPRPSPRAPAAGTPSRWSPDERPPHRLVPAAVGDANPDRDRGRCTTRPRQCGRTARTKEHHLVKNNMLTRGVLLTAVSTLAITLSACGSDDVAEDTGAAADTSSSMESEATESSAMPVSDEPFGEGCAAVPAEGEGSFTGMTDDPVATAASNNPALSTLVQAVTAANLGDTLNTTDDITVLAPANPAFEAVPADALNGLLADTAALTTVLTHHVIPGRLAPDELAGTHTTLNNDEVTIEGSGEDFTIAMDGTVTQMEASVICGNVQTANATVYIIDQVLAPASM